jgi:hypothetical protein
MEHPRTEDEADELMDNGRNTGGKSYYRAAVAQALAAGLGTGWSVEECAERCRREIEAGRVR